MLQTPIAWQLILWIASEVSKTNELFNAWFETSLENFDNVKKRTSSYLWSHILYPNFSQLKMNISSWDYFGRQIYWIAKWNSRMPGEGIDNFTWMTCNNFQVAHWIHIGQFNSTTDSLSQLGCFYCSLSCSSKPILYPWRHKGTKYVIVYIGKTRFTIF